MKYKVGDKTLLGEIDEIDTTADVIFPYKIRNDITRRRKWFAESEIDAIIIKPKRNIDHLIELWDGGKADKACRFMYDNIEWNKRSLYDVMFELFKPYTEPREYPILTPEELKAVKWLVDGGYHSVFRYQGSTFAAYGACGDCDLNYTPIAHCLYSSDWITETPIDLKELLEAQEGV
jgi:hypothetical protein